MTDELTDEVLNWHGWHKLPRNILHHFVPIEILKNHESLKAYQGRDPWYNDRYGRSGTFIGDDLILNTIEGALASARTYFSHGVKGYITPSHARAAFLEFLRSGRMPGNIWEQQLHKIITWIAYLRLTGQVPDAEK